LKFPQNLILDYSTGHTAYSAKHWIRNFESSAILFYKIKKLSISQYFLLNNNLNAFFFLSNFKTLTLKKQQSSLISKNNKTSKRLIKKTLINKSNASSASKLRIKFKSNNKNYRLITKVIFTALKYADKYKTSSISNVMLKSSSTDLKLNYCRSFFKNLFDINFLRKEKIYTKLKYSRVPQYDTVSGAAAALLAGFLGFLICEKFGFELLDSGDFYFLFMYLVFLVFASRLFIKLFSFRSNNWNVLSIKWLIYYCFSTIKILKFFFKFKQ